MEANTEVRLKFDPSVAGFTTGESRQGPNGEITLQVKVAGQRPRWFPESQLEIIVSETCSLIRLLQACSLQGPGQGSGDGHLAPYHSVSLMFSASDSSK